MSESKKRPPKKVRESKLLAALSYQHKASKEKKSEQASFPSAAFATVSSQIQPLDIVFFKGADVVSKAIQVIEDKALGEDAFTHVGVIVTRDLLPNIKQLERGRLYVWESTMSMSLGGITDGVPDVETGQGRFGVQIRDLQDVVKAYEATKGAQVAWGSLIRNPWVRANSPGRAQIVRKLDEVHQEYGQSLYDVDCCDMFAAVFPCLRKESQLVHKVLVGEYKIMSTVISRLPQKADPQKWLFCSQLVALVYQRLGVLPTNINPEEISPVDFLGSADRLDPVVQNVTYLLTN